MLMMIVLIMMMMLMMMMLVVVVVMCEPAQLKCTWTRHKSHFVAKFTGKIPDANPAANI